jgi:hypothetical protein
MNLIGEQFDIGKSASLSIVDVTKEELHKLFEVIESEVYTFGSLGHHNSIEKTIKNCRLGEHSFSSLFGRNKARCDYFSNGGRANIFIYGPNSEYIGRRLEEFVSAKLSE